MNTTSIINCSITGLLLTNLKLRTNAFNVLPFALIFSSLTKIETSNAATPHNPLTMMKTGLMPVMSERIPPIKGPIICPADIDPCRIPIPYPDLVSGVFAETKANDAETIPLAAPWNILNAKSCQTF